MKKIILSICIAWLLTACSVNGQKTYTTDQYTFSYPASWKTMAELAPDYANSRNLYWLGVEEEATLTSAKQAGQPGLYFSIASRPGMFTAGLETYPTWTYAILEEDIRELNLVPVMISGTKGKMYHYQRAWENKWYQFQDYWMEDGLTLYLLSFRAEDLSKYQQEIDLSVESFSMN